MTVSTAAATMGHLPVTILDNVLPAQRTVVQEAMDKTAKMMRGTLGRIPDTVQLAVSRNLDKPASDEFIAYAVRSGESVMAVSRDGGLNAVRDMFEDLLRQAVKLFK